ncbi:MAG: crossover junction endodeoxyribonuclease RuvC [Thermodesulfobacteriota bacterium]
MKVLGIDPGSVITGYGLIEESGRGVFTSICHGEIRPRAGLPLPERLLALSEGLEKVIQEHSPDVLSIESIFFAKNAKSSIVLGQARAVPLLLAAKSSMSVFEYAPRMVKLAITGYGAATKAQVQKMAGSLLNIADMPGPDASDALALALCHFFRTADGLDEKPLRRNGKKSWRTFNLQKAGKG